MRRSSSAPSLIATGLLIAALAPRPAAAGRAAEVRVEAFELLNEGVSAYNRGLYDEAGESLERCSSIALNSFRAYYYYGLALSASRRYAEAIASLEVALDLDPQDLQALIALGDAQLKLGDIGEARAAFARSLKLRPAHAPALDGLARTYEAQADTDKALDHFRQSINSNKGYAPAYTHLGDLYLSIDRIGDAVQLLEEAVTIRPDFAEGLNRLALAYGRLGMHHEAVATVQKAIELEPGNPFHLQTLGWLQVSHGLLRAAERSFRGAIDLDPRLPESHIGLAQVSRRRGDYELALLQLIEAEAIPDLGTMTLNRLKRLRTAIEVEELRVAELEARLAAGTPLEEDYSELADILARRGQWEAAAKMQRQAPSTPDNDEWLAYLLFQAGRYRESHTMYARLAANEDRSELRLNAGVALALLGNDEAAIQQYAAIENGQPGYRMARLYTANAELRMGRLDAAARNYRGYLDAGGASEPAERVRRILLQIAPEMLPPEAGLPLPAIPRSPGEPYDVEQAP
jgi:tetratricopeptide (TPR) repeat protein